MTRNQTHHRVLPRRGRGRRTALGFAGALAALLTAAAPAAAQAPHSCPSKTGVSASCVDDPTGVLLSNGADKGYVLVGGDPAAQKGELGVCARNPSTPAAPGGSTGGPGYYHLVLANPPSAPARDAQCPGAAPPPGDDYGQPQPQPQPEGEPESDPPPEPPARPRPKEGDRAKLKRCLKQAKKVEGKGKRRDAIERCHRRFGDDG